MKSCLIVNQIMQAGKTTSSHSPPSPYLSSACLYHVSDSNVSTPLVTFHHPLKSLTKFCRSQDSVSMTWSTLKWSFCSAKADDSTAPFFSRKILKRRRKPANSPIGICGNFYTVRKYMENYKILAPEKDHATQCTKKSSNRDIPRLLEASDVFIPRLSRGQKGF